MRSVVSRLARLERLDRLSTAPRRVRIQYGYLQTLPDDYSGPRHIITVRQLRQGGARIPATIGLSGKSARARGQPVRPELTTASYSSGSATLRRNPRFEPHGFHGVSRKP
jgi:hypothetical protein